MIIKFCHSTGILEHGAIKVQCSCKIKNELNGLRSKGPIVRTMPSPGVPYQPRQFPAGRWQVFKPIPKTDAYMAPYYIPTDAWQLVDVWTVKDGAYDTKTEMQIKDYGYGLHFSSSPTTLGCIKIGNLLDLQNLVSKINARIALKESVFIEVTA